jgi:Septum formation initiator
LLNQRSELSSSQSQLSSLHAQDAALAQEKKNLSDSGEIGRIARQQYQLVTPGQQAYEVLPPTGSAAGGTRYAGDPGSAGPVTPSASSELPPASTTTTTTPSAADRTSGGSASAAVKQGTSQNATPAGGGLFSRMEHTLEFWR